MSTDEQSLYICVRPHYWGASDTKDEAIDNCLRQGGNTTGMEDGEVKANIFKIKGGDDFQINPVDGTVSSPHDIEVVEEGIPVVTTKPVEDIQKGDYVSGDIVIGKVLDTVDVSDRDRYVVYQNRFGDIESYTYTSWGLEQIPVLEHMEIEDEKEPCYKK